ncbi:MAG: SRPBCC family protein [Myxococcales bacterium]|nr:MAG: SRPBCC family protein [Myxococcales bacterium]
MQQCRIVDVSFFDEAPARFEAVVEIQASPEKIFQIFEDARAWAAWAPPIQSVDWTSPKPFGVGTTRTVTMSLGMVGEELFIAWERGKRMAFCFTNTTMPNVAAFGEDYHVEDLGSGRCRVRWKMAMDPEGFSKTLMPMTAPLMRWSLQFMLNRFRTYVEAHPDSKPAAARESATGS